MSAAKDINGVIENIYEAVSDSSLWPGVLDDLNKLFLTDSSSLFYDTFDGEPRCSIKFETGIEADCFRGFLDYYCKLSPTYQQAILPEHTGCVLTTPMVTSTSDYLHSEFFNDFFKPNNFRDVMVVAFSRTPQRVGILAFRGALRREPFSAEHIERLSLLWPHVRRGLEMSERMRWLEAMGDIYLDAFDGISHGIFLLESGLRVIHCNEEARRILDSRDGLRLQRQMLVCTSPESQQNLLWSARGNLPDLSLPGPMTIAIERSTARPYAAWLVPLTQDLRYGTQGVPRFILVVTDPGRTNNCADALRSLYDLTPHEASVAVALGNGIEAGELAKRRRVSINTVRTQRAQIYAKLGVENQAQLAKVIAAMPRVRMSTPSRQRPPRGCDSASNVSVAPWSGHAPVTAPSDIR